MPIDSDDFFERLATVPVPSEPADFDHNLQQRMNKSLLVLHLFDLALRAMPMALFHFLQAVGGALAYSAAGQHSRSGKDSS